MEQSGLDVQGILGHIQLVPSDSSDDVIDDFFVSEQITYDVNARVYVHIWLQVRFSVTSRRTGIPHVHDEDLIRPVQDLEDLDVAVVRVRNGGYEDLAGIGQDSSQFAEPADMLVTDIWFNSQIGAEAPDDIRKLQAVSLKPAFEKAPFHRSGETLEMLCIRSEPKRISRG